MTNYITHVIWYYTWQIETYCSTSSVTYMAIGISMGVLSQVLSLAVRVMVSSLNPITCQESNKLGHFLPLVQSCNCHRALWVSLQWEVDDMLRAITVYKLSLDTKNGVKDWTQTFPLWLIAHIDPSVSHKKIQDTVFIWSFQAASPAVPCCWLEYDFDVCLTSFRVIQIHSISVELAVGAKKHFKHHISQWN